MGVGREGPRAITGQDRYASNHQGMMSRWEGSRVISGGCGATIMAQPLPLGTPWKCEIRVVQRGWPRVLGIRPRTRVPTLAYPAQRRPPFVDRLSLLWHEAEGRWEVRRQRQRPNDYHRAQIEPHTWERRT